MKVVLSVLLSAVVLLGAGCSQHGADKSSGGADDAKTLRIITSSEGTVRVEVLKLNDK